MHWSKFLATFLQARHLLRKRAASFVGNFLSAQTKDGTYLDMVYLYQKQPKWEVGFSSCACGSIHILGICLSSGWHLIDISLVCQNLNPISCSSYTYQIQGRLNEGQVKVRRTRQSPLSQTAPGRRKVIVR